MTSARKAARRVLREWCVHNGIVLHPEHAADLVARIEAALMSPAHRGDAI